MSGDDAFTSGKDHTTENFPVGSRLIAARYRPAVMAYYRFARAADDIGDAKAPAAERLARLDAMDAGLAAGASGKDAAGLPPVAVQLGQVMAERNLNLANASELLIAFRRDVTQSRYADWEDLLDYCRWSAMPVGRFMLDVHGEAPGLIPMSDALCAALQIINHLQDCREDYAELDRVYIPQDALAEAGLTAQALALPQPPAALAALVRRLATRCRPLLAECAGFGAAIRAPGLAYEVAVIHGLAMDLVARLEAAPFAKSRHHDRFSGTFIAVRSLCTLALARNGLSGGAVRSEAR
jgi:squalene synthase HpnC